MAEDQLFGIDYGKGPGNVPRVTQANLVVEAHGTCCREGIDLANIWTAPGSYNWNAASEDNGNDTYDTVVNLSLDRGIVVFGQIATTPWWALTLRDSGTASGGTSSTLADSTKSWNTNQWAGFNYDVKIVAGTGAGQLRHIFSNTATVITVTGAWTTTPNTTSQYEIRGIAHKWPPDNQYATAFQSACQEVASHFSTRITWWEFWNEENSLDGWHDGSSGASEYATWLIRCSNGVKAGNASAKVSVGGMNAYDATYIGTVRTNAQSYYDGIAVHPYDGDNNINTTMLDNFRSNMNSNGDGSKPILVTEYGSWRISVMSEATQAARVADALTKLRAGGPGWNLLMAAYNAITDVTGANFGLCSNASPNPQKRQAFFQFQAMAPSLTYKMPVVSVV